jgi:hypothetical protein
MKLYTLVAYISLIAVLSPVSLQALPEISHGDSPDCKLNETQYIVKVDLSHQLVHVYFNRKETRTMICSTGLPSRDNATPNGRYIIDKTGTRRGTWFFSNYFQEGASYWVGFIGGLYLFHSVPMDKNKQVLEDQAALLGKPASHGCVRLSVEDARWFYENIPSGTVLYIEGVTPGEEDLPQPPVTDKRSAALWLMHRHQSYYQQHLLSCEAALVRLVLAMQGVQVGEEEILDHMPKGLYPENAFVCTNIDQGRRAPDGSIRWNNYGAHPPVVRESIAYWLNSRKRELPVYVEEEQLSDQELRELCMHDERFLGAVIWVVGHPDRWGIPARINERGMVLGEHVRYLNPLLADNGDFLIWDPEASADQPRHYSAFPTRKAFQDRVLVIRRRTANPG